MNKVTVAAEAKISQVQQEMQRLKDDIDQNGVLIARLRDRISGILELKPALAEKLSGAPPLPTIVPFASEIREQRLIVERCNRDLMELIEVCEL